MSIIAELCRDINRVRVMNGTPTWESLDELTTQVTDTAAKLRTAVDAHDLHNLRLSLVDLLAGVYAFEAKTDIDVEADLEVLHEHIVTSADADRTGLDRSVRKYRKMGMNVATKVKGERYLCYLRDDYQHPNGGVLPAGTWLPRYGKSNTVPLAYLPHNVITTRNKYASEAA